MPAATLLDIPGAAIAALLIVAVLRWAYRGGEIRRLPMTGLVIALAVFVVWRIIEMQTGPLTVLDAIAGILGGVLMLAAFKAAWGDGPFDKTPKGHENTPFIVLVCAVFLIGLAVLFSFRCVGNLDAICEASMPRGQYVETLPPGNWQ